MKNIILILLYLTLFPAIVIMMAYKAIGYYFQYGHRISLMELIGWLTLRTDTILWMSCLIYALLTIFLYAIRH